MRIRSHGMTRNALSEIVRANVLAATDVATDSLRKFLEPAVQVEVAPDIDLSQIPLEVATLFKLASANVSFDPERLKATPEQAWGWTVDPSGRRSQLSGNTAQLSGNTAQLSGNTAQLSGNTAQLLAGRNSLAS